MNKIKLLLFHILFFTGAAGCQLIDRHDPSPEKWYIELNSSDVGFVRGFADFELGDSTFVAYTRKNVDRELLGYWTSFLGRLFTSDFKNGSLINIHHGTIKHLGDTLALFGIFQSAIGSYYFNGKMVKGVLNAVLTAQNKTVKGRIRGSQKLPSRPLIDYPALLEQAIKLRNNRIYKVSAVHSEACKKFDKKIRLVAQRVQDDLEMEFAFFYYAGKLPFSHFSLLRPTPPEHKDTVEAMGRQVQLEEKSPLTFYLKIHSFSGTAAEMDSVFAIIVHRGCQNLIVDLRDNSGGGIEAGMQFARWVSDSAFYGGVFLTQKWFAKHPAAPQLREYSVLPHFTESSFDLLLEGIHQQEGLCLKVVPEPNNYRGKLFLLVNGGTASTCEPIVYGLKQRRRALIIGEKTAGAMLNGEFFKLASGFSLMIPTADYYAADGYRIDKQGVSPSVEVKSAEALNYVMDLLKGK